eukprot:5443064-Pleurochrysis_carterae.AAC.1
MAGRAASRASPAQHPQQHPRPRGPRPGDDAARGRAGMRVSVRARRPHISGAIRQLREGIAGQVLALRARGWRGAGPTPGGGRQEQGSLDGEAARRVCGVARVVMQAGPAPGSGPSSTAAGHLAAQHGLHAARFASAVYGHARQCRVGQHVRSERTAWLGARTQRSAYPLSAWFGCTGCVATGAVTRFGNTLGGKVAACRMARLRSTAERHN